jgi:hypothetical protein
MQYAIFSGMGQDLVIDAMELAMLYEFFDQGDPSLAAEDLIADVLCDEADFSLKLFYGYYRPQPGISMAQAKVDAVAHLGANHGTIRRRECHPLELCDLEMGEPVGTNKNFRIPVAALIASKIEKPKGSFALTAFLRYANIAALDNAFNRPGLYALKAQEKRGIKEITRGNWRAMIDRERMVRIGSKSECNRNCGCGR